MDNVNHRNRDSGEGEINLLAALSVMARRKKFITGFCAAAFVLSAICTLLLPKIFVATARVVPPQKDMGMGVSALLGQMGSLASLAGVSGTTGTGELYVGILKSRSVADAVIKRLGLLALYKAKTPDDARMKLAKKVKFQIGKDGIIVISAENEDPKMAAALANAMVDELGRRSVQLNLTKAGVERAFFEKRIELVKQDLKTAEDNLKSFAEQNKAIKVESQATVTIAEVAKLKAEIAGMEVQLSALRSYQTDESPEVKILKTSLRKLQSQLATSEAVGSGGSIPGVGKVPSLGLEYARRLREVKTQEAIYEQLAKQYEAAKLMEAKDSSSLQVLDEAVVPAKKSKPKRTLIVILSTFTAFIIGTMGAFLLEYLESMPEEDKAYLREIRKSLRVFPEKGASA